MASRFDLEPRIEALQAAGLVVESEYRGSPPKWVSTALDGVDLYIVNCKGTKTNDTLVLVRLSKLEELLETESACQLRTEISWTFVNLINR
jgi:hypothetical protein